MRIQDVLCTGSNKDGSHCTKHRTPGKDTCRWHDRAAVEARARALEEQAARLRAGVCA